MRSKFFDSERVKVSFGIHVAVYRNDSYQVYFRPQSDICCFPLRICSARRRILTLVVMLKLGGIGVTLCGCGYLVVEVLYVICAGGTEAGRGGGGVLV